MKPRTKERPISALFGGGSSPIDEWYVIALPFIPRVRVKNLELYDL